MIRLDTITEGIASRMLADHGIAAIWQLQVAAAMAHRTGNRSAAVSIMEIAEAAERVLMRRENASVNVEQQQ